MYFKSDKYVVVFRKTLISEIKFVPGLREQLIPEHHDLNFHLDLEEKTFCFFPSTQYTTKRHSQSLSVCNKLINLKV